ncbi:MAG: hypothetical protein GEV07_29790 [Streptosporangiales bacterium]|nr:hypothetical protein [Streptosporangiales bacterium]
MSGVKLDLPCSDYIRVFTSHFTPGASQAATDYRQAQAVKVLKYLRHDGPLLFTGDVNARDTGPSTDGSPRKAGSTPAASIRTIRPTAIAASTTSRQGRRSERRIRHRLHAVGSPPIGDAHGNEVNCFCRRHSSCSWWPVVVLSRD